MAAPLRAVTGRRQTSGLLRWAPAMTLVLFLGPVAVGMAGTLAPAFGILPVLGGESPSLQPWRALFNEPGLPGALTLTITTGISATAIAIGLTVALCAWWHDHAGFRILRRLLSPFLSVPHAAVALGLAFLIAPSGWLLRVLSPWATGFDRPPDIALAPDPFGFTLVAALVMKEVPFLLLMVIGALGQLRADDSLRLARTLGYGAATAWLTVVFPGVYRQIRLPVYAVLAFSLSVVDVALVLGPTTPPPLAVLVMRWFNDPDIAMRFQGSAGAVLQMILVVGAISAWFAMERVVAYWGRRWIARGNRGVAVWPNRLLRGGIGMAIAGLFAAAAVGILGMCLWSFTRVWRWPAPLPETWTMEAWIRGADTIAWPFWNSVSVGLTAAALSLGLCLACLEQERRRGFAPSHRALWLLYTPLIVPQIGFLFGLQIFMVVLGWDGAWGAVVWSHLMVVLPYVFLSLSDPFRALDARYDQSAACLGLGPTATFWRVRVPLLLRPILVATAVGFAVSISQYLPTVFTGAGRIPTLTTEAISLSAGANRRVVGVYVLLQTALPFVAFGIATLLPIWRYRTRRALRGGS